MRSFHEKRGSLVSRRLLKDSIIYTGGNILSRGLNFIIQVAIWSNLFPPESYGQLAYCYVFISFMAVILPFGLDAAFMNYFVRRDNKSAYLKNTIFLISTIAVSFILLAMLFRQQLAPLAIRQDSGKLLALSLGILFFDIINNQGLLYLRAEGKALFSVILQNIEIIVKLGLLLLLVSALTKDIQYILWSNLASSGLIFVIFLFILIPKMRGAKVSKTILKELLIFGLPFLISGIFDRTIELSDRRLIGYYLGDNATGLYVASYTVAVLMRLLIYSFNAGWQPYFLSKIDEDGGKETVEKLYSRTGTIFIAVWFIASVWLPLLIKIPFLGRYLLHPSYWDGIKIIPVIMGAYVAMGLYFLQLPALYYYKKTALNALFIGVGALVNIILNVILIPLFGIVGAAAATLMAYFIMAILLRLWVINKSKFVKIDFKLPIIVGISLILFLNICLVNTSLFVKILVTVIYLIVILLIHPLKLRNLLK